MRTMNYAKREKCPHCGRQLITPSGPTSSKVLLVGEFPGVEEVKQGIPFIGRAGDVLRAELLRVGLIMSEVRITNLWQHAKSPVKSHDPKAKPKEGECDLDWHLDQIIKEFKGKTHVLLMGSDVTETLLGDKVMGYSGLRVRVPPYTDIHFWVSPNPAIAFKSPIGEMRLAFGRFAEDVNRKKK